MAGGRGLACARHKGCRGQVSAPCCVGHALACMWRRACTEEAREAQDPSLFMEELQSWSAGMPHAHPGAPFRVTIPARLCECPCVSIILVPGMLARSPPAGAACAYYADRAQCARRAEYKHPKSCFAGSEAPCGARASWLCEPRGHVPKSACARLLSCISAADMGLRALM